jgi:hypothetical protein
MLCRVDEKKLSTQSTSSPADSSRSHKWEPRNPEPPVTNMRLPDIYTILSSLGLTLRQVFAAFSQYIVLVERERNRIYA